ncbi:MAG: hypothetical protein ACR652_10115 [Methylocystis sp.]|uniref:hypothetical protein n=1 Tax=Methylocystis sp. TaxID=1911079 RepID=UPI003DA387D1
MREYMRKRREAEKASRPQPPSPADLASAQARIAALEADCAALRQECAVLRLAGDVKNSIAADKRTSRAEAIASADDITKAEIERLKTENSSLRKRLKAEQADKARIARISCP